MTFLVVHLNPDHESCQNLRGELAASRKSLCLSSPDRGRAVELLLRGTGRASESGRWRGIKRMLVTSCLTALALVREGALACKLE